MQQDISSPQEVIPLEHVSAQAAERMRADSRMQSTATGRQADPAAEAVLHSFELDETGGQNSPEQAKPDNKGSGRTNEGIEVPVSKEAPERKDAPAAKEAPEKQDAPVAKEAPETKDVQASKEVQEAKEMDAMRLKYLQQTLYNLLPATAINDGGDEKSKAAMQKHRAAVLQEAERGEFGPETQKAYKELIQWFEKNGTPVQLQRMKELGITPSPQDLKMLGIGSDGKAHLGINTNKPPSDADLEKIDAVVNWLGKTSKETQASEKVLVDKFDKQIEEFVKENKLPQEWLKGEHTQTWRENVPQMAETALKARTYIEVMDELNRSSGGAFPFDPPPGTKIQRDSNNRITKIELALPDSADLSRADNKAKMEALDAWTNKHKGMMEPVLSQLKDAMEHPERAVSWGDQEMHGVKGRFDKDGNFLGIVEKDAPPKPGEQHLDMNLLESRIQVNPVNGKVEVVQQVQAQKAPWYAYQNMVFVDNVGKKIEIKREFAPDDFVVIRRGDKLDVLKAKDLSGYASWEKTKHHGEKFIVGVLDVAMVATGLIEVSAAYKAARLAGTAVKLASTAGLKTLAEQGVLKTGLRGGTRVAVGLAGTANNAGARDHQVGQLVNTGRSIYFIADISHGLGTTGWNHLRKLATGEQIASVDQAGQMIARLPRAAQTANRYSQIAFKGTEVAYTPFIFGDLYDQVREMNARKRGSMRRSGQIALEEKRN